MTRTKQKYKLAGAAATVMFSMVISRATGFLRSTLIPNLLTKNESDALYAAFSITNFMYFLLVGGSIAAALIPVLSGYIAIRQEKEGWAALSTFVNCIIILMIVLSIAGIAFSEQIVDLVATKLNSDAKKSAVDVTRIMFPSVCFMMLAGLTNGVLNSYKRFAAAAYGPAVYNTGTVISLIFLHKYGVNAIAWGIMGSSLFYFLFQFSFALSNFRLYRPCINLKNAGFRKLVSLAVPSILVSSVTPLNVLISQHYASFFSRGSLTAYSNATDIWQLPYGIFAMGLGTALLPTLSEKHALKEGTEYSRVLEKGLRMVIFLVVPSAAAFLILSRQVVSIIYKWSPQFDSKMLSDTADLLIWFTIALIAQSMLAILNRAYYARNDVKTPVAAGLSTLMINVAICHILVNYARNFFGLGGIALAYSLQSIAYAGILFFLLARKLNGFRPINLFEYFIKVAAASLIMVFILYMADFIYPVDFSREFSIRFKIEEVVIMAGQILIGVTVYFIATILLVVEEAHNMLKEINNRTQKLLGILPVKGPKN